MGKNLIGNRIPTVGKESGDLEGEIKARLDSDTMALAIVGTHRPIRVTPKRKETVSIDLQEELDLSEVLTRANSKRFSKLVLVIHSPGGSVESSYKVARLIRKDFSEIKAFVPHLALSGGTLIALTGNEIIMGEMSNLTPIDVQRRYKGKMRSVNAMIRSFDTLTNYFSKHSKEEAPYPWISLAEDLDPVVYQDWYDTRRLMEMYAMDIMTDENAEFKRKEARRIISLLLKTYPSHSYALMREEFSDIIEKVSGKTVVKKPSSYPTLWKLTVKWQRKYKNAKAKNHIFRYVTPSEGEEG